MPAPADRGRPQRHRPGPLPLRPGRRAAHPHGGSACPTTPSSSAASAGSRPAKRFDVLIRALARLPADHWLLLVGGGPEEHVLRRTAREAGVADRVLFTGERPYVADGSPGPDLPSLTCAMDVFVSPSAEETFGLAVVEALAVRTARALRLLPGDRGPARAGRGGRPPGAGGPEAFARALAEARAAGPGPRTAPEAARHYDITRSAAQPHGRVRGRRLPATPALPAPRHLRESSSS